MKLIPQSDGTFVKALSPIEGVPFYSDWLLALLMRHAAREISCGSHCDICRRQGKVPKVDPVTGSYAPHVMPTDRDQLQASKLLDDGTVGIYCIGCARLVPAGSVDYYATRSGGKTGSGAKVMRASSNIRIGGLVQFSEILPERERIGDLIVSGTRAWKPRMVAKAGIGCEDCRERYAIEAAVIADENEQRNNYVELLRAVYIERKDFDAAAKVKPARQRTAFLDILTGSVALYQYPEGLQL